LHDVFSLTRVADDSQGNAEDKTVVAVEKDGEGIVVAGAQISHQLIVTPTLQLA
jgi:hypothetical protein